jgi:hypothetical protein
MAVLHSPTLVKFFGSGRLDGLQAACIFAEHPLRKSVMFFICLAPAEVVLPAQLRFDLLPPPASASRNSAGPNSPFLPDLFPAVLLRASILAFCLR